jgi:hypothetical protein
LTWRGEQQREEPSRIRGASKKLWRPLRVAAVATGGDVAGSSLWPSLAASAIAEAEIQAQDQPEAAETPVEGDSNSEAGAPPTS